MILIRAGLLHLMKSIATVLLACGSLACLILTYAYISGDRTDREEMHASIARVTGTFHLIPDAQAESSQTD